MSLSNLYMGASGASVAVQLTAWMKFSHFIEQNNTALMFFVSVSSVVGFVVIGYLNYALKKRVANTTERNMIDKHIKKMYRDGKSPEDIQYFLESQNE